MFLATYSKLLIKNSPPRLFAFCLLTTFSKKLNAPRSLMLLGQDFTLYAVEFHSICIQFINGVLLVVPSVYKFICKFKQNTGICPSCRSLIKILNKNASLLSPEGPYWLFFFSPVFRFAF